LEGFNGYGYSLYRNINSPYLWSGSNNYTAGKYIADNVYSKTAVSSQIGIALLLKNILERI
jgi:lysozyme family protein